MDDELRFHGTPPCCASCEQLLAWLLQEKEVDYVELAQI